MAEYYVSIGNLPLALNQLGMALEAPGVNAVDRARFQARRTELREYLPDQHGRHAGEQPDPEPFLHRANPRPAKCEPLSPPPLGRCFARKGD